MLLSSTLKRLFAICVFTAFLLTTVASYACTHCSSVQCSSTSSTTCDSRRACFSLKQEFKESGQLIDSAQEKGCSSGACTPLAFSATLGDKRTFSYDHRCCYSEQCNKEDVPVSLKPNPNGIECPACYNETGLACDPVPLQCTGAETKCIEVIGIVTFNSIRYFGLFAMGCATESACNLNMNVLRDTSIRTKCVGPNSGSPH